MHARHIVGLACYTLTCIGAYNLLNLHYQDTCKRGWFSVFGLDSSPYCGFIRKALSVLQWSPLVAAGFIRHLGLDDAH